MQTQAAHTHTHRDTAWSSLCGLPPVDSHQDQLLCKSEQKEVGYRADLGSIKQPKTGAEEASKQVLYTRASFKLICDIQGTATKFKMKIQIDQIMRKGLKMTGALGWLGALLMYANDLELERKLYTAQHQAYLGVKHTGSLQKGNRIYFCKFTGQ